MTAVCCPAKNPCPDHTMLKADLADELQRTRAELAQARIMLNAVVLATNAEMPADYFSSTALCQLYDRVGSINIAARSFLRPGFQMGGCAEFLRETISRQPLTYAIEPDIADRQAQLAEATQ